MTIQPTAPVLNDPKDREEVRKALLDLALKINKQTEDNFQSFLALSARFGGDINYTSFAKDGTLKQFGTARNYKDLIIPAANLRPGATAPTYAAFIGNIFAPRFDAGTSQILYGSFELQHDYYEGSDLYFHLHWSPTTTNTGNIVWGVEYTIVNGFGTFPVSTTVVADPYAAPGVINEHVIQGLFQLNGSGLKIGAIMAFRVYRQNGGTDTFTGNAFLHSVGVHYSSDTLGSKGLYTKE